MSDLANRLQQLFVPPPIPLRVPETKVLKHGDYMNVQLRTNPNDTDSSKYKMDIPFFKDGTPEECVQLGVSRL
jgi:hypothetical protein